MPAFLTPLLSIVALTLATVSLTMMSSTTHTPDPLPPMHYEPGYEDLSQPAPQQPRTAPGAFLRWTGGKRYCDRLVPDRAERQWRRGLMALSENHEWLVCLPPRPKQVLGS